MNLNLVVSFTPLQLTDKLCSTSPPTSTDCHTLSDLQSVNSVRAIEQGELWRISAKDVSKLFQISYCSEVEGTSADLDMSSVSVVCRGSADYREGVANTSRL